MQLNCWSLRCSWSIACRRCSNYIFILDLTPAFNGLGKDNYKTRRETFKFWDWEHLILEVLRYVPHCLTHHKITYWWHQHYKLWKSNNAVYSIRADSRLAPSQWETLLLSNAVSHWLGANLESALQHIGNVTVVAVWCWKSINHSFHINSMSLGDLALILNVQFSNVLQWLHSSVFPVLLWMDCLYQLNGIGPY